MPKAETNKAIKSLKWSFLNQLANRLIGPIITLILVRILSPDNFGIFGAVISVILLIDTFADLGLYQAIIRLNKKEFDKSADTVFWTTWAVSAIFYVCLFLLAPFIAAFYHSTLITNILRITALSYLIPGTIFQANLQRSFNFKKIFYIGLINLIVPGLISILLSLKGFGVMALVFGNLSGAITSFLYLIIIVPWKPKLKFHLTILKTISISSWWIVAEKVFIWFFPYGEFVIIGHYMGFSNLGVYQTAFNFLGMIFGLAISHSLPISYTLFSKLKYNPLQFKKTLLKTTQIIFNVSLPLGIALSLLSRPIGAFFFNDRWQGIEIILTILSIRFAFGNLLMAMPEALRATGRADINAKLGFIGLFYFVPAFIIAAHYNLKTFALLSTIVMLFDMVIFTLVLKKIFKIPLSFYFKTAFYPAVSAAVMGAATYFIFNHFLEFGGFKGALVFLAMIITEFVIYFLSLYILKRESVYMIFNIIRRAWQT